LGLSRRKVLQGAVALTVSGVAPLRWVASAGAAPVKTAVSTSWLSRSSYAPLVGSTFAVTTGGSQGALTLNAIRDLTPHGGKQRANASDGQFSLLFTSGSALTQGSWPVHHDALGDTTLFMVPIGPRVTPRTYEVIVNRLP
jgi:hypothetical protein